MPRYYFQINVTMTKLVIMSRRKAEMGRLFPVDANICGSVIKNFVAFGITDLRYGHLKEKFRPKADLEHIGNSQK